MNMRRRMMFHGFQLIARAIAQDPTVRVA